MESDSQLGNSGCWVVPQPTKTEVDRLSVVFGLNRSMQKTGVFGLTPRTGGTDTCQYRTTGSVVPGLTR